MVVGKKPAKEAEIRFFLSGLYKANIKPFRVIPDNYPHRSEFNRGMPEGVTPKATIINFEAAKEKRLEEKKQTGKWVTDAWITAG